MKKRRIKVGSLLAAFLCLLLVLPVSAQESPPGVVRIYMEDAVKGTPLSGGVFSCFQVAEAIDAGGEKTWRYTDAFRDCGAEIENMDKASFVREIAWYAQREGLSGNEASADGDGCLSFSVLPDCQYLVVQIEATVGYYPAEPFLIRTPSDDAGGEGYRIHAIPKVMAEQSSKVPEETTAPNSDHLPQTGQLWWPVPILTFSGLLAIAAGMNRNRRGKGK